MQVITSKPATTVALGTGSYPKKPIPTPDELEAIAEGIRQRNKGTDQAPVDGQSSDARIAQLAATLANQTGSDRRVCHMLFSTLKRLAAVEQDLELARGAHNELAQRLAALESAAHKNSPHTAKTERRG